ncbi:hypothetical protein F4827_003072 [Paraburkholderia bannensis]|uniref:Uncharacterized protein n=1 Tax=Paraburkholderia bannensis TaxID=765414 RepID=A0A7W9TXG2_9BURK|nr:MULTISPECIES: hypothetical protein [Paraburkholderia]MBB3258204.1 hypothetical protein [Paraburkholderia sp. WP4_3_2]MBB6103217.1 hypothetical protein [Paraburkholderia bannensis]
MSDTAKAWFEWTTHEEAILAEIWALPTPIKTNMHRLPRRSPRAAMQHAHEIGLPPRTRGKAEYSAAYAILKMALERGPNHALGLAEVTGVSYRRVHDFLRTMHAEDKVHITGWRKTARNGPPPPVYAWGEGDDVPRPRPAALRNRLRHKKDASMNPFAQIADYARKLHREAA